MDNLQVLIENAVLVAGNKNKWLGSKYEKFTTLPINDRGDVGEELFFKDLCQKNGLNVTYKKNIIDKNSVYDGTVNGFKVEVKTASLGNSSDTFQHENFYSGADFYTFIDICPNYYYLTILSANNLKNIKNILGVSLHERRDTNAKKLTFSQYSCLEKNGINYGVTKKIDNNTTQNSIKEFITNVLA